MDGKPGNLTAVTGAKQPSILGGVYFVFKHDQNVPDCLANA